MSHPTPEHMAIFYAPCQIKRRIDLIKWNLENPVPAVASDPAKLAAVRKEANRALRIHRAALRIHRKTDARQVVRERYSNPAR